MKRLHISLRLPILLMLAMLLPALAAAHDFEVDGIFYNIINDNEVEVTYRESSASYYTDRYSGAMTIPSSVSYNGKIYTVTTIGKLAFYSCKGLTSINIPNSVIAIGISAFNECTQLSSIQLPNSVINIGYYAFDNTAWYNSQPEGLVYIGLVLYNYKGTMPDGANITIIDGTLGIVGRAFYGCTGLTSISIPNSVTSIGNYAFYGCTGLTSISIPNSVSSIGDGAFYGCTGLTIISIPNSVTTIGDSAFSGCAGLTSISIPNLVTSIGNYAFRGCTGLTSVIIPNSVTSIGYNAFRGCTGLTSISIPNSVTTIGDGAFSDCTELSSINIPNSVTTIGNGAFNNTKWYNNQPDGLVYAGAVAYKYKGEMLENTTLSIREGTVGIAAYAFDLCNDMVCVTIPNSIIVISDHAFYRCDGLERVNISDIASWCNISFYDGYSSNPLYYAQHLFLNGSEVKDLVIPSSVTSIGQYAFYRFNGLTSVSFANSVTTIGEGAFYECQGLTSVVFTNSVTTIGKQAFYYCSGLTNVSFGNSVTTIDQEAFELCSGLTSIEIPNSVEFIGFEAFAYCSGVNHLTIGKSVRKIGARAFGWCNALLEVYSLINNPSLVSINNNDYNIFYKGDNNYSARTLHVPAGTLAAYQADANWYPYFGNIVEISNALGDVDGDGNVTIGDVTNLIDKLLGGGVSVADYAAADVDSDGNITIGDVTRIIDMLLSGN